MPTQKIYLVAVDGSEWGNRAADYAISMAKQTGARIRMITVIPWSSNDSTDEVVYRTDNSGKYEEKEYANNNILAPIIEKHKDSGVAIESEYLWGKPVEVIHKRAKETKANQIFVGRRGRSRFANLVLGSVANSLAHTVGKPITLVP
ncbi:universal stress protein [Microbulbifer sp. 2205BS26-8]|uniref:universal stress protein n=1 Tax=Microbulbifer sp. 2205BS26-8 TaxID=3064386 RepID=UPI00273E144F|nr:universal stress protein [Microbulbifer sp. 2205BS26-8]MDP5211051.1 universal stress protein [Microbulbifer sp. 2205BS26-8]